MLSLTDARMVQHRAGSATRIALIQAMATFQAMADQPECPDPVGLENAVTELALELAWRQTRSALHAPTDLRGEKWHAQFDTQEGALFRTIERAHGDDCEGCEVERVRAIGYLRAMGSREGTSEDRGHKVTIQRTGL